MRRVSEWGGLTLVDGEEEHGVAYDGGWVGGRGGVSPWLMVRRKKV